MGPEILKKYDEAIKRFNDNKAQAKDKAAPRGGVGATASMITLDPKEQGEKITAHAVKAPVANDYYAMVDSGTNAVIVPLHREMCGEFAKCKVPNATVEGPIAQVLEHQGNKRLVVALPQSAALISLGSLLLQDGHLLPELSTKTMICQSGKDALALLCCELLSIIA